MTDPKHEGRVLVVDDDQGVLDVVSQTLSYLGYVVTTVAAVRQGIEALSRSLPDVVITDLSLPDGNGRELLQHVRAMAVPPPVIVMSASPCEQMRLELLAAGATRLLPKPFLLRELIDAVHAATWQGEHVRQALSQGIPRAQAV